MSKYINQYNNYAAYSGDSTNFSYPHAAYLNEEGIGVYDRNPSRFYDFFGTLTGDTTVNFMVNGSYCNPTSKDGFFYCNYQNTISRISFKNSSRAREKYKTIDKLGSGSQTLSTMEEMFYGLNNLEECNISNLYLSGTSMKDMFNRCNKLQKVEGFENIDTSNVTNFSSLFYCCNVLDENKINLSNLKVTSAATNIGGMFYGSGFKNVDFSQWDTSNVTNMANLFDSSNFPTLDLSNFNTSACTTMNGMFFFCKASSINTSSFDTSNVTNMGLMFRQCSKITTLDLSHFNTSACTVTEQMFWSGNYTSLNLSNWDLSNVTNDNNMFQYCNSLINITMNNTNQTTLEKIQSRLVSDNRASYVTIHRDGYAWTYSNNQWVSTPE